MNKLLIWFIGLISISFAIFPQGFKTAASDHYKVSSEVSDDNAKAVAAKMEGALLYYNQLLHFDLAKLTVKLRITIYKDKTGYDDYLKKILGVSRDDFVYIYYSDQKKRELVGFDKPDETDFNTSLLHQGFIQFIKEYIPNVPVWISDGIAAFLESAKYTLPVADPKAADSSAIIPGTFTSNPNLGWLDTLKSIIKGEGGLKLIPLSDFLTMERNDAVTNISVFYPESWGFIYFLLTSPSKAHSRILWDSFNELDPTLSVKDNSIYIKNKIFLWINEAALQKDFVDYIVSAKTFNDLVTDGLAFFNNNELPKALDSFLKAAELKPGNYIPQYYIGLVSYTLKDYDKAEPYYLKALELGAEKALVNYALGINAYANNKYDKAVEYLKEAAKNDPKKYGDKTDVLLKQIETEQTDNKEVAPDTSDTTIKKDNVEKDTATKDSTIKDTTKKDTTTKDTEPKDSTPKDAIKDPTVK